MPNFRMLLQVLLSWQDIQNRLDHTHRKEYKSGYPGQFQGFFLTTIIPTIPNMMSTIKVVKNIFLTRYEKYNINSDRKLISNFF